MRVTSRLLRYHQRRRRAIFFWVGVNVALSIILAACYLLSRG